ncbi:copper oxidase [Carbonactinospora thermoautotrophica]|uniref:Copper oxidase n=3 Tax=Carbonactinospora thermoautotrophica TaxID=1469144 RepID=A0A132MTY5_9ACTN|nr:multicopper oxidase family protein [Carbonactinospora thermoautotrophica]KWX01180.1 Multicopper oxidase type 3 [Carbonactinospora thermoautotrophica]KWX05534.1 copper oxidase [Carbonactinospora thermoautotrophica]
MKRVDRRAFVRAGLVISAGSVLSACSASGSPHAGHGSSGSGLILPGDPRVRAVEGQRRSTGRTRAYTLTAAPTRVDLGGPKVTTWAYGGELPGREIRVRKGDVIEATLVNQLPAETTIHWHGLALRNDMDGVPAVTQQAIRSGSTFTYRFVADTPGTYWFHPHTGVQQDRGLYAPLIIEDPDEPAPYDAEWVVVLDDWIDGVNGTPDELLAELRQGMGHGGHDMGGNPPQDGGGMDHGGHGMDHGGHGMAAGARVNPVAARSTPMPGGGRLLMGARSSLLGGDAGDVRYPHYLINGRVATAPRTLAAKPRQRVRIRLINASGDTAFRVALGGHRMTVTHTDGFPVRPVEVDALLIGMGERYDVLVTLDDGVFPLVALAEGKNATGLALVRTGAGSPPPATIRPKELDGKILRYADLTPAPSVLLPVKTADVTHRMELTGDMMSYSWGINGKAFDPERVATIREGQRVRVTFANKTTMWHPMHIHGHTFQINGTGPRKDTVNVLPGQTVTCDFDADNPGQWMVHCHNVYHAESGMMTVLGYLA